MKRRRINLRFLLVLLVVSALAGGGAYGLYVVQTKRNAGYLLTRGEQAEKDGDKAAAASYYSRFLALRPGEAETWARYGILLADTAVSRREKEVAFLTLERALREDAKLTDVRRKALDLAVELKRFADAKAHAELLLGPEKKDAELKEILARCDEETGRIEDAIAQYDKVISEAPARVESYVRLAGLYRRTERAAKADDVMNRLIEANRDSKSALMARFRYYMETGRPDAARDDLAAARKADGGNDAEVLLADASLAVFQNRPADARKALEQGLNLGDPRIQIALARLELNDGKFPRAVELLRAGLKLNPEKLEDLWELANHFVTVNELSDAEAVLDRLKKDKRSATAIVGFIEGRLHLARGQVAEAAGKFESCRADFVRSRELALPNELGLAECYERLGRPEQRLDACRKAFTIEPTDPKVRAALADALLAAGELNEAFDHYKGIMAQVPVARVSAARIRIDQARRLPQARRDLREAAALLDESPATLKDNPNYVLTRAELLHAQNKSGDARMLVEAARDKSPDQIRYWLALTNLAAADGGPAAGLAVLRAAEDKLRDQVDLRLARAWLLTRQTPPDLAALRTLETGADAWPEAERDRLQLGLARVHQRAGAGADAERLVRSVADRRPADLVVLTYLFDLVVAKADAAALGEIVEKLRKAEAGDGPVSRFADALRQWLTYRKDPVQNAAALVSAKAQLEEARKRRPAWSRVPLLDAEMDDHAGNVESAIEKYQLAIKTGARNTAAIRRLSELLTARRRLTEAQEVLNLIGGDLPEDLARSAVVLSLERSDPPEQTLEMARRAVPADSKNYKDYLWLGRVAWKAGQNEDAEKAFRRAIALNGAAPDGWATLVAFLAKVGRLEEAKAEIAKVTKAVPPDQLSHTLGMCYEAVGDRAEAEKHYAAIVRDNPSDLAAARSLAAFHLGSGSTAKAEPLLRRLIAEPGPAEQVRWARRALAMALALGGDYQKGSEALRLLETNLKEQPGAPEDLRTRAIINAARPGGRRQSIKDLESSFVLRPTPGEEFLLARIYEIDGNWPKARELFEALFTKDNNQNAQFLGHFIRSLLRHDDPAEAAVWLARLEAAGKRERTPLTVELKARLLVKQKQPAQAATLLKEYAREGGKANPVLLRNVGLLLAELEINDHSEELLVQYAAADAKNPHAVFALAQFLARQGKVEKALEICANAAGAVGPEAIAVYAVGIIRLGEGTASDLARAEQLIRDAARQKPESLDIQVSLADLRDAQGRYDDAKQIYRSVLARNPRHQMALNNLAWLLALHEGKGDEALLLINTAIESAGPVANLLDTRGIVRLAAGQGEQAVGDLSEAVAQAPLATHYYHLAQAHRLAGRTSEAQRAMRQAQEQGLQKKDLHALEWAKFEGLTRELGLQ